MSKLPPGWNQDKLLAVCRNNMFGMGNTGICKACGAEREGCEPDARNYECYECGEHRVFGAQEILMEVAW